MNNSIKENHLISVIIPVYNVEQYLDRCLESVVNQTYKNLEIILVDDGSPDNCPKMCDEWAKKDSRIKVIHKQNGGASSSRNTGLDVMTGDFMCFIDSDDFIAKNYIEVLYNNLIETNSDVSMCMCCYVYENRKYKFNLENKRSVYSNESVYDLLFYDDSVERIVPWCKIYKKEIFENLRFKNVKIHEDELIMLDIFSRCKTIVKTYAQLYYYFQRNNSTMGVKKFNEDNFLIVDAVVERYNYFKNTKWENIALSRVLITIAYVYYIAKRRKAGKEMLKRIKSMYNEYYKQNQNKTLQHKLFYYFPNVYYYLRKIKWKGEK